MTNCSTLRISYPCAWVTCLWNMLDRTAKASTFSGARAGGCHLKEGLHAGIRHCDTVFAEDPAAHLRVLGGQTRRGSDEWNALYSKRWSIERIFKSLKESRRLEEHCVRGLKYITLHALMSTLTFQATALAKAQSGDTAGMRWMVRKIV